MKRILISLFFAILLFPVVGQNDPVYSQYMFNPLIINPAYAGVHDMASVYAVYKNQWGGFGKGSPVTSTLSGQTTIPKNNIGLGFSFVNDRIGVQETNEFNAIGSYKLELGGSKYLSFGLQGGFLNASYDYSDLKFDAGDESDVNFEVEGSGSGTKPTVGAGLLWTSKTIFFGVSVPRLLDMTIEDGTQSKTKINRNVLVTGGYVFHLAKAIKIKPSIMVRYVEGAELVYDINGSILLKERFWLGASVRSFNTVALMGQIKATDLVTAGMAYELPIDGKDAIKVGSTFEVMLNLNMSFFDVQAVQTIFY
jgi:type IX secretion system PorP/SprF family membrane protein